MVVPPTSPAAAPGAGPARPAPGRTGVWLVGARGSVATSAVCGAAALRHRAGPAGRLRDRAGGLRRRRAAGVPGPGLRRARRGRHAAGEAGRAARRRRGAAAPAGRAGPRPSCGRRTRRCGPGTSRRPAAARRRRPSGWSADLAGFRDRHELDRVVVVNVSSTEPPYRPAPGARRRWTRCAAALRAGAPLPPSALYAYAAFTAGCSFVDFTPSTGAAAAGAGRAAPERPGVPYAGHDGKTGETLVKSVLAPMFAMRNLRVAVLVRASTCSAAATAPTWPTRRRTPPRSPASSGCSAETLGYRAAGPHPHRLRRRTSATSRPPGT